jgi:hypothetical protein
VLTAGGSWGLMGTNGDSGLYCLIKKTQKLKQLFGLGRVGLVAVHFFTF